MTTLITNERIMWKCWILMLCATGISCVLVEPQSFSINPPPNNNRARNGDGRIRRYACPVGFFRLKRNCYYLSAGTTPWREAYFHCKDRNSTLAALDKKGKDRTLRKYLMGEQFTKLERWIGGIYNWQQMAWEWGVSGDKIVFQNFAKLEPGNSQQYAWHCIVMDPSVKYKWKPRNCIEKKHYICEVPAGRIARRRRKRIDQNLVPQNQRQKTRKRNKYRNGEGKPGKHNRVQNAWKRNWEMPNGNQQWGNGVKVGYRPPAYVQLANGTRIANRTRHRSNRLHPGRNSSKISQIALQSRENGSFLSDGPARGRHQAISQENTAMNQFQAKISDFSYEEVLLKT